MMITFLWLLGMSVPFAIVLEYIFERKIGNLGLKVSNYVPKGFKPSLIKLAFSWGVFFSILITALRFN